MTPSNLSSSAFGSRGSCRLVDLLDQLTPGMHLKLILSSMRLDEQSQELILVVQPYGDNYAIFQSRAGF